MDASELELFDQTLRRATEAYTGQDLDVALAGLCWRDALAEDHRNVVSLLFERQGETGSTSSALDDVLGSVLGLVDKPGIAVLLPGLDCFEPPGSAKHGRVTAEGLATGRVLRTEEVAIVASAAEGEIVAFVRTSELTAREVAGMDPWLGLVEITGVAAPATSVTWLEDDQWGEAVRRARLALGHELVGAASGMLELARAHARERVQFGRPIGSFQAVQHRLADTLVAVESSRAVMGAAWEDGSAQTAMMAKAIAGRAARMAARHCQQVLAGMGFTTEHRLHRYVRRVLLLDELFGSARSLTAMLGRQVLADGHLPSALPL